MIKEVIIKSFMSHTDLHFKDIPNLNVFVGKNDTGKTGILKLLYSVAKSLEIYSKKKKTHDSVSFKKELAEKLLSTFMPRNNALGELVHKGSNGKLDVEMRFVIQKHNYNQSINFSFGDKTQNSITHGIDTTILNLPEEKNVVALNSLFIPAKEVLTTLDDIRTIREQEYGRGFDDTYFDLVKALDVRTQSGNLLPELSQVNRTLEALFEGKIEQTKEPKEAFIFKKGNQRFSMQQTAEGIKKIGILTTLINNRQLKTGTILFMDEPETALHPSAVRQLVERLVEMSKANIQIFIATHSYFVIKQLAICAKRDKVHINCWSLNNESDEDVILHDLIDGMLPNNSIIDESLEMYNDDLKVNF